MYLLCDELEIKTLKLLDKNVKYALNEMSIFFQGRNNKIKKHCREILYSLIPYTL